MPLEATMIVLDDSEWMRNGDFPPSRWEAQNDATRILFDAKVGSNPESKVGLMTMAGKGPRVLASLTQEMGKIVSSLHGATLSGSADVPTAINIAQLALKHRQNKSQHQRIVVFIGSPIKQSTSRDDLIALGKKLKKNNVALDVVSFGEEQQNADKLEALLESVNSGDNSHLVTVSASQHQLLSDVLLSSQILIDGAGPSGAGGAGAGGSGGEGGNEWGVDPNMDPELAMALRMSLEEEQARQRAAEGSVAASGSNAASLPTVSETQEAPSTTASASTSAAAPPQAGGPTAPAAGMPSGGSLVPPGADALSGTSAGAGNDGEDDEDAMLQRALALSAQPQEEGQAVPTQTESAESGRHDEDVEMGGAGATVATNEDEDEEMTEEEAIAHAIQMSLQDAQPPQDGKPRGGAGSGK
ncbi:hypothetical protein BDZ90DRAFT_265211 [Jaminaea rosea]|uniref:VWFA domain-containing protein n=1 Tax=Jaminaea rosea TaxID=1569628 RepID=A0A316UQV1_9BASI|nr:hypothetical protein BDZ90DRAFT_265211 [Jaminaea rosea]PWN26253.1 hypothetical protein BDZ90DRAFT_265211 [Jaminaea rosea]